MSLTFTPDPSSGKIYDLSGYYINNAPGFSCRGTPYALTGRYYVNTQTLSFNVVWTNASEDCQSVTGWTGYINLSSPLTIQTDWNLAYVNSSGQKTIDSGSDVFTQTGTTVRKSLKAGDN